MRVADGEFVARPTLPPGVKYGFARSPDGALLYYAGADLYPQRQLLAFDTRALRVAWRESLEELEDRSSVDSLELLTTSAVAPSPDGTRLLIADARRNGASGVAILDGASHAPVDFLGPLMVSAGGMAMVPASSALPSGGVAIAATREEGPGPKDGWLFILDGATLGIRDSVKLTSDVDGLRAALGQVVSSPDGTSVYIHAHDTLFGYDVRGRRVVAAVQVPMYGYLAVAQDGSVYACDYGDGRNYAGGGILYRYTADLSAMDSIDLRAASVGGAGPTVQGVAASDDGQHVYALIGNPSIGPLFPGQPLSVLVIDAESKTIIRSLPTGEYGAGSIFVR